MSRATASDPSPPRAHRKRHARVPAVPGPGPGPGAATCLAADQDVVACGGPRLLRGAS